MTNKFIFISLLSAACGGGASDNLDAAGPDAAPSCVAREESVTLMVPEVPDGSGSSFIATWQLDAIQSPTTVIAHNRDAAGLVRVALIDSAGTTTELAAFPGAANYALRVVPIAGTTCAVLASGLAGLGYACPGKPFELAPIRNVGTQELYAVPTATDLVLFGQTFSSFTRIDRSASGVWSEIEQFESSISFPTDATIAAGAPLACYIDAGKRAQLTYQGAELATENASKWCKIAVDGSMVHVLTDIGYAAVPLASITRGSSVVLTPLATSTFPERLIVMAGQPYAMSQRPAMLTPVPSGAPIVLPSTTGRSLTTLDAETKTVHLVSSELATSGPGPMYPQTLRFQTACL